MKVNKKYLLFLIILVLSTYNLFSDYTKNPELIFNGDFELRNTGFTSEYINPDTMKHEGRYAISNNAKKTYNKFDSCRDHTTGSGYFMLVNGDSAKNVTKVIWGQKVSNIKPNQFYRITVWCCSLVPNAPAVLNILINNGEFRSNDFYLQSQVCLWTRFDTDWFSGSSDTALIEIVDINKQHAGNDFGIDDISMKSLCSIQADAGSDKSICPGDFTTIGSEPSGDNPPYLYSWSPNYAIDNVNFKNPRVNPAVTTSYIVTVTDALNCTSFDTVTVVVLPVPKAQIISEKGIDICPCDSTRLIAPNGYIYLWSTGETGQSIIVKNSGIYKLLVTNSSGCIDSAQFSIEVIKAETAIELGNVQAKTGDTIILPVRIISSSGNKICGFNNFRGRISYDKSLMLPVNRNLRRTTDGMKEILDISGNSAIDFQNALGFCISLGDTDCTDIKIESFSWDCSEIKINTKDGSLCLSNICREGSKRLVDVSGKSAFLQVTPNPASDFAVINFYTTDESPASLELYNLYGQIIDKLIEVKKPGYNNYILNTSYIPEGIYFIKLNHPTNTITVKFNIIK